MKPQSGHTQPKLRAVVIAYVLCSACFMSLRSYSPIFNTRDRTGYREVYVIANEN